MASSLMASSVFKLGAIVLCAVLAASSMRRTAPPQDCDSLCETACSYLESAACNGLCIVPAGVSSERPTCQSCKEATKKSCNTECVSMCNTTPDSPSSCSASE
ncbi:hypothetical protein ZWY2020_023268 [Hordeum vulgare]|uniref:Acidic protein n=1 Tax=Hordeum vulgare subsp. vulgare TaxID=112509 RepID=A0A8I6YGA9_HORVV|nr:hypothetical protein ZWY2020_023268 [Hordeum vulgare]